MIQNIISTITESVTGLLGGIGSGCVDFFTTVFLNAEGTALNPFGVFLIFTMAVGMAIGIMRWIRSKV